MNSSLSRTPFFSIIIPAYNAGPFIQTTLQSVYNQTFSDYEIIVVNDGSTDETAAVLERQTDARLQIIHQKNAGVSAARNRAINQARGKYLAFLDADDVWTSDHLALAHLFFTLHPEFIWYCAAFERATEITDDMLHSVPSRTEECFETRNWVLEIAVTIAYANVVILRSAIPEEKLFPEGVKMCEDTIAFMKIAIKHPMIGYLNSRTMWYRKWGNSACDKYSRSHQRIAMEALFLDHYQKLALLPESPLELRLYALRASYTALYRRIRSLSMIPWLEEIKRRRPIHGNAITLWLICCAYLCEIGSKIAAKPVNLLYRCIHRKMMSMAMSQRRKLTPLKNAIL